MISTSRRKTTLSKPRTCQAPKFALAHPHGDIALPAPAWTLAFRQLWMRTLRSCCKARAFPINLNKPDQSGLRGCSPAWHIRFPLLGERSGQLDRLRPAAKCLALSRPDHACLSYLATSPLRALSVSKAISITVKFRSSLDIFPSTKLAWR